MTKVQAELDETKIILVSKQDTYHVIFFLNELSFISSGISASGSTTQWSHFWREEKNWTI